MTDTTSKTCPACFKDIDSRALRCSFCAQRQTDVVGFYRDVPGKLLGGVCAAVAQQFNLDVTLTRILFVVSLAVLGPITVWAYLAAWVMTPFEQAGKSPGALLIERLGRLFSTPSDVERVE